MKRLLTTIAVLCLLTGFAVLSVFGGTSTVIVHNASATKWCMLPAANGVTFQWYNDPSTYYAFGNYSINGGPTGTYFAPGTSQTFTVNAAASDIPKPYWRCSFGTINFANNSGGSGAAGMPGSSTSFTTVAASGASADLYVTESGAVAYTTTNYTMTLYNTSTTSWATAKWFYNGTLVKTSLLSPLTHDSWTTPALQVTPAPAASFTLNGTVTDVIPTIGLGDGSGILFTNPATSGSLGGSAGSATGSGGASTNSGSGYNIGGGSGSLVPNTNAIIWQTPSGSASESTLQAGFSTLHGDNQNIIAGESLINSTIGTGQLVITNQLGQVVTLLTAMSNETLQVIGAITNMSAKINTNPPSLSLTNYATESTLAQINTNLAKLVNQQTNSNTNSQSALSGKMWASIPSTATNGDAATSAASTIFSTAISTLTDTISGLITPPDVGTDPGHTSIWDITFCGHSLDLDPVDNFPTVAAFSVGIWDFLLVAAYLWSVGQMYVKVVQILASANTGGVPNMDVFGGGEALTFGGFFGGNFIGVLVAVIIPAVFLVLWVAVVTVVIVPLSEFIGLYGAISTLFSSVSSTESGKAGMHLLFAFFPIALAIRLLTARIVLQFTMAKAMLISSAASRYLFGK